MKPKNVVIPALLVLMSLVCLLGSCTKPPVAEMEAAKDALTRAENDPDAVTYAGNALIRARELFNQMQNEADAKRYDSAKSFASETIAAAEKAIADGRLAALRVREEAAGLVADLKRSVEETQTALDNAKQVKNTNLDFESLDNDFNSARSTAVQAEAAMNGSRYQEVQEKSRSAKTALSSIMVRLADGVWVTVRKK
ncbi:MAG: DUF4398 domain-containing protein [Treponema sp.]|jgi:type VI protein secretion system component VasK|nr:DUF4398 domain-containing protein [Treponema sp.]